MESIFQKERCRWGGAGGWYVVAEPITNKLSPPEDLPTRYASVSSFFL